LFTSFPFGHRTSERKKKKKRKTRFFSSPLERQKKEEGREKMEPQSNHSRSLSRPFASEETKGEKKKRGKRGGGKPGFSFFKQPPQGPTYALGGKEGGKGKKKKKEKGRQKKKGASSPSPFTTI